MTPQSSSNVSVGYLNIGQQRIQTGSAQLGHFDILFVCASYEPRAIAITKCSQISADKAYVFRFEPLSSDNNRAFHAEILRTFASEVAKDVRIVVLPPSVSTVRVQEALRSVLAEIAADETKPVSVAIDISTMPKSYFSQIIAAGIGLGVFHRVTVFYSETDYSGGGVSDGFQFTEGSWKSIQVPFLEGEIRAGAPRHSIVSVGADVASLERFVRRYEPDSMTLLVPVPGASEAIDKKVREDTSAMKRRFGSTKLVELPAFDVRATLGHLQSVIRSYAPSHEVGMFCLGTKPHALAMGLIAILDSSIPLVCRVPERYRERSDAANGWAWLYKIFDSSNPRSVELEFDAASGA